MLVLLVNFNRNKKHQVSQKQEGPQFFPRPTQTSTTPQEVPKTTLPQEPIAKQDAVPSKSIEENNPKVKSLKEQLSRNERLIQDRQREIEKIEKKIATLGKGMNEEKVWELNFKANELILDEKTDIYEPAKQIIGELSHFQKFDKIYKVVDEKGYSCLKIGDYEHGILVVRGSRIKEFKVVGSEKGIDKYEFITEWKGDNVFPSIRVDRIIANLHYNKDNIGLEEARLKRAKQELQKLLDAQKSLKKDLKN